MRNISPVVKNLIILNVLLFIATWVLDQMNPDQGFLVRLLGLHYWKSEYFMPVQLITHMFMHGGFFHIFFNMFALYMFGSALEQVWGGKRFFIYYIVTGLGAALLHLFVIHLQVRALINAGAPDDYITALINIPTVGASGAVFGVLLGFGMLFPNTQLLLLFPPIPIKAKYMVMIYGALELYLGITQPGSSIAHFAHLGGMLFGFILIRMWKKNRNTFY